MTSDHALTYKTSIASLSVHITAAFLLILRVSLVLVETVGSVRPESPFCIS